MTPNVVIANTGGLSTHGNDLSAEPGSTAVADNVTFSRERLPELRRGFKDFSTNLPDFAPEQLIVGSNGVDRYLHLDSGLWYYDTTSATWLRKRGALGGKTTTPYDLVFLLGHLYVLAGTRLFDINLSSGLRTLITATAAAIHGIATDGTDIFYTDYVNHVVLKLTVSSGAVSVFAGSGISGSADGTGAAATFNAPQGICCDGTNLYIADTANFTIRKIVISSAVVTTIAGTVGASGSADGTGAVARFNAPNGIATDGASLYVCDDTNATIRRLAPPLTAGAAVVTTIAGTVGASGSADGTGAVARFKNPLGICCDGTNLYVSDFANSTIRRLAPPLTAGAAVVTTIAGVALSAGGIDGIATVARMNFPRGVAWDGVDLYVADSGSGLVRKMYLASSYMTTIAGVLGSSTSNPIGNLADGIVTGPS